MLRSASLIALGALILLCAATAFLVVRGGAYAASLTLIVDTTAENNTLQTCDDGGFQDCSLAGAIIRANNNVGVKDRIVFNVGGGDDQMLAIIDGLPSITDPLEIDGTTQPRVTSASLCIDSFERPCIHLRGPGFSGGPNGLSIDGTTDVTVKGLAITDFYHGIWVNGGDDLVFERNFLGTADGTTAAPNAFGISITNDTIDVRIGGTTETQRNVASGNVFAGVDLGTHAVLVQGNYVGTDKTGLVALPNNYGISVRAGGNVIGGSQSGMRNVISGNTAHGIYLFQNDYRDTTIQGNYIGVNATGNAALGNGVSGIRSRADAFDQDNINVVGNVISGNVDGIRYELTPGGQILGGRVYGNIIGLNADADAKIPNIDSGIRIDADAAGSAKDIAIDAGPEGDSPNIIAGNGVDGVYIGNQGASGTVVSGNFIGTNEDLAPGLGNGRSGVLIVESPDNVVGAGPAVEEGEDEAKGNVVLNNAGWGVTSDGPGATRNTFSENSIDDNTQTGIFSDDGANPNATAPVLAAASSGSTHVTGTIAGTPNTQIKIEFFRSPACDPSGFGEGRTFIGSANVTTNGSGSATINATLSPTTPAGQSVTATATHADGATSEFSNCVAVTAATPSPTPTASPSAPISGDANCSGGVTIDDVLATLNESAGVDPGADCPNLANVDCDGDVDSNDMLHILFYIADVPMPQPSNCPEIGDPVT